MMTMLPGGGGGAHAGVFSSAMNICKNIYCDGDDNASGIFIMMNMLGY